MGAMPLITIGEQKDIAPMGRSLYGIGPSQARQRRYSPKYGSAMPRVARISRSSCSMHSASRSSS